MRSPRPELPMTPRQRLMWLEDAIGDGLPLSMVTTLLVIKGDVDPTAFSLAFDRLVARHDALRMALPEDENSFTLMVSEDTRSQLEFVDLTGRMRGTRHSNAGCPRGHGAHFRPAAALIDACLIKRAEGDFVFFLNRHHMVSDNRSSVILHDELSGAYLELGGVQGPTQQTLETAPSFAEYLKTRAGLEASRESREFWERRFASKSPMLRLYGGPALVSSILYDRVSATLDSETSRRIDKIGRPLTAGDGVSVGPVCVPSPRHRRIRFERWRAISQSRSLHGGNDRARHGYLPEPHHS